MGVVILVGIFLSYGSRRRAEAQLDIVAQNYKLVKGRVTQTFYSGVSGYRPAKLTYDWNGQSKTLLSRYNIPCDGRLGSPPKDTILIAISKDDSRIAVDILSQADYKKLGLQFKESRLNRISCLKKVIN